MLQAPAGSLPDVWRQILAALLGACIDSMLEAFAQASQQGKAFLRWMAVIAVVSVPLSMALTVLAILFPPFEKFLLSIFVKMCGGRLPGAPAIEEWLQASQLALE